METIERWFGLGETLAHLGVVSNHHLQVARKAANLSASC